MTVSGHHRAGLLATTRACSAGELETVAARAPWHGSITWWETAGDSTIAACGSATRGECGSWLSAAKGMVVNAAEAAERLDAASTGVGDLVAAVLAGEQPHPSALRGAFVGVALDRQSGELRAVRSFGGGLSLARSHGRHGTAIATEASQAALLATGRMDDVDDDALHRYATGRSLTTETFFVDTHWLLPGCWMSAGPEPTTVALLDISSRPLGLDVDQARDAVASALDAAVLQSLAGAGRLGSMATGGLDSSSLVGFATRHRSVDVAVTTRVQAAADSAVETSLAAAAVRPVVGSHHIVDLKPEDLIDGVVDWIPLTGPPMMLLVGLITSAYERAAVEGVDVVLDGLGGDFVFDYDPLHEAVAESRWGEVPRALVRRRRNGVRVVRRGLAGRILHSQRHHISLPERFRWRVVHNDAASRTRIASRLGMRLEMPYLDHVLMATAAGVPSELRSPGRQLQRDVVSKVLPHPEQAIKARYSDALERYLELSAGQVNTALRRLFAGRWRSAARNGLAL